MSNSKHLALRTAIAALMTTAPALCSGRVYQNRRFTLPNGVLSQLHVNLEASTPLQLHMGLDSPEDWETDFELRVLARKDGATEAADAADAIWVDAYARLRADDNLGGLDWQLVPGVMQVDTDEADSSVCVLTWTFSVKHQTTNNTIS